MRKNLDSRLKRIERQLNSKRREKENTTVLIDLEDDPNSEYKKLLKREKNGNKVDWDNYIIIHLRNLSLRGLVNDNERP